MKTKTTSSPVSTSTPAVVSGFTLGLDLGDRQHRPRGFAAQHPSRLRFAPLNGHCQAFISRRPGFNPALLSGKNKLARKLDWLNMLRKFGQLPLRPSKIQTSVQDTICWRQQESCFIVHQKHQRAGSACAAVLAVELPKDVRWSVATATGARCSFGGLRI